jgi:hypothetical protein
MINTLGRHRVGLVDPPAHYDSLSPEEQALVRGRWSEEFAARIAELDFAKEFAKAGIAYAELDEFEQPVVRTPPKSTS